MSANEKQQERLLGFDQQFEFQAAMVLAGIIPHGGSSLEFIIKMLERQHYSPERLEKMRQLSPLLKEEIEYLQTKERFEYLNEKRPGRLDKINAFIYGDDPC